MSTPTAVPAPSIVDDAVHPWRELRRAAWWAIVANIAIVMSGVLVRVTGSGLGCPDWPTCANGSIVPQVAHAEWHTYVEYGNRLMSFVVLAVAGWVIVQAWRATAGSALRRGRQAGVGGRQVRGLAVVLVAGVLVQAVIGGITVLTGLLPLVVATHFLASMVLLAAVVVLHGRAATVTDPDWSGAVAHPDRLGVAGPLSMLGVVAAGAVLVLGTLVTASGPHSGGDPGTRRLALDIRTMAVAHADAVWFLVAVTIACVLVARWAGAARVQRAAMVLLGLELAQGALGYAQYALGVPAVPVFLHVVGAAVVWTAAWHLWVTVRTATHPT